MPTRLILIRHGETPWNLKEKYCGFSNIGLNKKGITQAKKIIRRLGKEKISQVYSSDSKRALDFARIVFKGCSIKKTPRLREMDFGIFEGLTYQQIMKKYPEIYSKWLKKPFDTVIPNGEGLKKLKMRVKKILTKIISQHKNKTIAIITHAGPIRITLSSILKLKNIWDIECGLASINIIEFNRGKARWGKLPLF